MSASTTRRSWLVWLISATAILSTSGSVFIEPTRADRSELHFVGVVEALEEQDDVPVSGVEPARAELSELHIIRVVEGSVNVGARSIPAREAQTPETSKVGSVSQEELIVRPAVSNPTGQTVVAPVDSIASYFSTSPRQNAVGFMTDGEMAPERIDLFGLIPELNSTADPHNVAAPSEIAEIHEVEVDQPRVAQRVEDSPAPTLASDQPWLVQAPSLMEELEVRDWSTKFTVLPAQEEITAVSPDDYAALDEALPDGEEARRGAEVPNRSRMPLMAALQQPSVAAPLIPPVSESEVVPLQASPLAEPAEFSNSTTQTAACDCGDRNVGAPCSPRCATNPPCPYCPTQSGAYSICGVDCSNCRAPSSATWKDVRPIPWALFGPGEYVGPPRTQHVSNYFIRVNDRLDVVYMLSRQKSTSAYRIGIGDRIAVDSMTDDSMDRELEVQPDGTVSLPLVGEVQAEGKTLAEFRDHLVELLRETERNPQIAVNLVTSNVALADLIDAVDRRSGSGGQSQYVTVTPEGTIQLPGIGSVYVQGLTLEEVQREIEARYAAKYGVGLSVTPLLTERAPTFVFIGGEVRSPGRFTLEGPTTVMQAITLAGGWNVGGNTNQIVVFRRNENWCLKATKIDLFKPLYGKDPCPVNDIWLRDNDLVIVPKRPILVADDIIDLYLTRGAYRVLPITFFYDFTSGSVLPAIVGP